MRIGADNSVTVMSKHLEMGQGTYTGLATILADELDADWKNVRVEGAAADAKRYNNTFWGPTQGTGGSTAMANSWDQMRKAGASGRAMLVSAAAKRWNVGAAEIVVRDGIVSHAGSGRKASFGELALDAANETVPTEVKLKDPKDFRLIGKQAKRKDSAAKTNGTAQFTQDVFLPGMLVAVVAHPPQFGATVKSFDATKAKAIKGVVDVVQIPQGVAVLATDTWSAKKGRDALSVSWDDSKAFKLGSDEILAKYKEMAKKPGLIAANTDRRHGENLCRRRQSGQRRLRFPLPRPCRDGADELRRPPQGRWLRSVERRAVPDRRSGPGRRAVRPQAGAGQTQHALRRRQFRAPGLYAVGLRAGGGAHRQGDQRQVPRSSWSGCARTTCAAATTGPCSITRWKRRSMAAASWSAGITGWSGSRS